VSDRHGFQARSRILNVSAFERSRKIDSPDIEKREQPFDSAARRVKDRERRDVIRGFACEIALSNYREVSFREENSGILRASPPVTVSFANGVTARYFISSPRADESPDSAAIVKFSDAVEILATRDANVAALEDESGGSPKAANFAS